jgi:exopolyphosphatase/guanosine-5'-triphosphate,3'-diphosphate pyrophosphatase
MRYVDAALEDGVMYGMLGGVGDATEVRRATVGGLQTRYGIDVRQARRVRNTAEALFDGTAAWWDAEAVSAPAQSSGPAQACGPAPERPWRELLGCAAALHELGLAVSARAYHRHGAYLLKHADLRGFSALEREYLALLVRGHRRALPLLAFSGVAERDRRPLVRLVALLRIAVILERSHADSESPRVSFDARVLPDGDSLTLVLPRDWTEHHPLSMRELGFEPGQLAPAGIRLALADA